MVTKSCFNGASTTKAQCKKWQRTIMGPRWTVMYHAISIFCFENYTLMLKKMSDVNLRRNFLVHVYPYNFCPFRSVKFYCRCKWGKILLVKGKPKWRLSTIPHFVDNDFISSYRHFMPKLCTCCNTNWLHSNRAENQFSIYAFRGSAALIESGVRPVFTKRWSSPISCAWPNLFEKWSNPFSDFSFLPKIQFYFV